MFGLPRRLACCAALALATGLSCDESTSDDGGRPDSLALPDVAAVPDANLVPDVRPGDAAAETSADLPPGACASGSCAPECFRAVNCVAVCGGPVTYCGCCSCAAGSIDTFTCS
jgi:hypothetical protein